MKQVWSFTLILLTLASFAQKQPVKNLRILEVIDADSILIVPLKAYYNLGSYPYPYRVFDPDFSLMIEDLHDIKESIRGIFELAAFNDCRANKQYNKEYTERVANSFLDTLIKRNVFDPTEIIAKGYGESWLLNDCRCENGIGPGINCTKQDHQKNRRFWLIIRPVD